MSRLTWRVGDATILRILEVDASDAMVGLVDGLDAAAVAEAAWLRPGFVTDEGRLRAAVQVFVVVLPSATIVVDPGVGNEKRRTVVSDWSDLHTTVLDQMFAAGVDPAAVDYVINTHLHFDHVGGNTRLINGRWEPTYPKARYVMSAAEFAYWEKRPAAQMADQHAGFADSVLPVAEAGLVELVADDHVLNESVRFVPSPGHTPHHVSVLIESREQSALFLGDLMHHPCQIAHPEWSATSDFDADQARVSRMSLVDRYADTDTLVIGAHFADPVVGRIRRRGGYTYLDTDLRSDLSD